MQKMIYLLAVSLILTACSHTYYIVRHAEKAVRSGGVAMSTPDDPPLNQSGTKRSEALKLILKDKNIRYLFSTNTTRTLLTAEPFRMYSGLSIETYGPRADSVFIHQLKRLKRSTLIIGHSNTVDDLVNGLTNKKTLSDLSDNEYDNLFIVRYTRFFGTKIKYERKKY